MDNLIIYAAKYLILIPPLIAVYVLWRQKPTSRKQTLAFILTVGLLSFLLALIAQNLYVNPRPPFKDGSVPLVKPSDYNGFPSDHTLFAAALGFGILRFAKSWGRLTLLIALVVGWARVAARVHHAIDIVGAFLVAAIAYCLTIYLFNKYSKKFSKRAAA